MPSISKYRKVWFAIMRQAGIDDEDERKDLQEEITGKRSTKDWNLRDWNKAVAYMQRKLGQHNDQSAHVCGVRPHGRAPEDGDRATTEQVDFIEDLIDQVEWREGRTQGPIGLLLGRVMADDRFCLRREIVHTLAEKLHGRPLWFKLTRDESSMLISALKRFRRVYPKERKEEPAHA